MKRIIILSVYLLFLGCRSGEIDPYTNGIVTGALFNGKPWENTKLRIGFVNKCYNSIELVIEVNNEQGFKRETFGFFKIPLKSGEYTVKKYLYENVVCLPDSLLNTKNVSASYNTSQDDGDVGKDNYSILENSREINKLVISKYDGKSKYISGEFSATFLLKRNADGTKRYFDSVDTIRITKARFEASGF